ncbi:EAL domain-containing protein [Pigmentiphaga aceris]|uniref:cyclic-guanylate-specific phosphodiesterase n=1 Tax=Pigmentiphaga aceris TaxID=1940612 RepID=A0A5C0B4R4_9BURK|nr:EAL domain-containing protein [Pigmentiphaga aceris]QEI07527.1 EAL domain-containing protein [Pigmentiphaga aceris]
MIGQQLSGARAWVIGCGLLGLVLGAALGELAVRQQHHEEAATLAASYIARADQVHDEVVKVLAQTNAFAAPACSDEDIAYMRGMVIRSQFIKSVARLDGEQLLCGATLGRLSKPVALAPPNMITPGGMRVNFNANVAGVPDVQAMVVAHGRASVIVSRLSYTSLVDPRLDYAIVVDVAGKREHFISNDPEMDIDAIPLISSDTLTLKDRRYEVSCSKRYPGCIVATLASPPAVSESPVLQGFAALGLLTGMGGGLGISLCIGWLRSLRRRLRRALHNGDLTLVYQPIVRLADRHLVGVEALLRWKDESGKPVNPEVFIAIAEQAGFINEVTRFVVRRTLAELALQAKARPGFRITINISVQDLTNPGFLPFVAAQLKQRGLPADSLGFEVTERSTAEHEPLARGIQKLRDAGHSVYLDDFGTEYSSLSYLADLSIDAIKLDRVFTMHLDEDSNSASIAPQIVAMAKGLGLGLVVEGIEEERQAAYFLKLDPTAYGQGWLFGTPVPADRLFER